MKKDITAKGLIEHSDVFADIANVNLFKGRQVLQPEDLEAVTTESSYKDLEGGHHVLMRDCLQKVHKLGGYIGFIGYEAQTGINNVMPVRDMGYAYTAYMKQIRNRIADNYRNGCPAFAKVLHDDQKLLPVVTCVLYFGTEPWEHPLSLLDVLDISEGDRGFWEEMVGDYRIHVISLVKQPKAVREQYRSDFRIIADYLACYDDEERLVREWMENKQILMHPEQLLDLLAALGGDRRMKDMREALLQMEKKEESNMSLLMDIMERDYKQKGIQEGLEQGLEQGRAEGIRGAVQLLKAMGIDDETVLNKVSIQFSIPVEMVRPFL